MNCHVHAQTPAVASCRTCGKPLCDACRRDVHDVAYCEDCLATRVEGPGQAAGGPNPTVAAFLAAVPGVGAMYCGEFIKAIVYVVVLATLIAGAAHAGEFFGILIPFWWVFMIVDAYRVARARQQGLAVPDPLGLSGLSGTRTEWAPPATGVAPSRAASRAAERPGGPIGAYVLIGMGVLFLLQTMDVFHFRWLRWSMIWPLIVLGLGIQLLGKRRAEGCPCVRCTAGRMMGPAVMLTVGLVGFLDGISDRLGFETLWPLLLIVIGVILYLRSNGGMVRHMQPQPTGSVSGGAEQPEARNVQ